MIARGAHINAVGAIGPEREELAQDVFERVSRIAVDSVSSVQNLSKEFKTRFGPPGETWAAGTAAFRPHLSRPETQLG